MKERRLFIAIPLPATLREEVIRRRDRLELPLKYIPAENLHITLLFMGSVEESKLAEILNTLHHLSETSPPFLLTASSIVRKPGRFHHMLWTAFDPSRGFEDLATRVAASLHYPTGKKPLPHVNLVRSRRKIPGEFPVPLGPVTIEVKTFELWESHLHPSGATYSSLGSFTLKGVSHGEKER